MFKVIIFSVDAQQAAELATALEPQFQVTSLRNPESLPLLARNWRPHIIVYLTDQLHPQHVLALQQAQAAVPTGVVVIQSAYNLRSEISTYEHHFDHYFVRNTPIATLKSRLTSLAEKVAHQLSQKHIISPTIVLPSALEQISFSGIHILAEQKLILRGETRIKVTPTQFKILHLFITNPNKILEREWIGQLIFKDKKISPRTIDAHVAKLRAQVPELKHHIVCHYGLGYLFLSDPNTKKSAA